MVVVGGAARMCVRALCVTEGRTSGMLCCGFRIGKENPDLFFISLLPRACFRILRHGTGYKQTKKNIKNKFS